MGWSTPVQPSFGSFQTSSKSRYIDDHRCIFYAFRNTWLPSDFQGKLGSKLRFPRLKGWPWPETWTKSLDSGGIFGDFCGLTLQGSSPFFVKFRKGSQLHQFFFGGCRCTSFHLFPHLFLGYVIHNMYTSIYALILFLGNLRQRKVHPSGVARLTQGPSVWAAPHVCWYVPVLLNRDRLYLTTFFGWFPIFCWLNLYIHS